tara:strand:- start:155 stop:388 length:234 start_codon:yes stop_codon:yes gene_type:complete
MNNDSKFTNAIIQLHDIARLIEQQIGTGQLSADVRNCADRLHVCIKGTRMTAPQKEYNGYYREWELRKHFTDTNDSE